MALKELIGEGVDYFKIAVNDDDVTLQERNQLDRIFDAGGDELAIIEAEGWSRVQNDANVWEYTRTKTPEEMIEKGANVLGQFSAPEEGGYDKPLMTRKMPILAEPSDPRGRGFRDLDKVLSSTQVSSQVPTYLRSRLQDSAAYDQAAKSGIQGLLASEPVSSALANLLTRRV
jgi:hypothetical protein